MSQGVQAGQSEKVLHCDDGQSLEEAAQGRGHSINFVRVQAASGQGI